MSTTQSKLEQLLGNNREFAKSYETPPTTEQLKSQAATNGGLVIVTCLDPRCVPEKLLGGPQAIFASIRNAGGSVTKEVIKDITLLRSIVNPATVLVMHHTDCGATHLTSSAILADAKARTPAAAAEIDAMDAFHTYNANASAEALHEDVRLLREAKVLAGIEVRGLVLDTETGVVREVVGEGVGQGEGDGEVGLKIDDEAALL